MDTVSLHLESGQLFNSLGETLKNYIIQAEFPYPRGKGFQAKAIVHSPVYSLSSSAVIQDVLNSEMTEGGTDKAHFRPSTESKCI